MIKNMFNLNIVNVILKEYDEYEVWIEWRVEYGNTRNKLKLKW